MLVLAIVNWRVFRLALAVAALFHIGVFLMMNIAFSNNVLTYGAFVLWSQLRVPTLPAPVQEAVSRFAYLLVPLLAVVVLVVTRDGNAGDVLSPIALLLGAVTAAWYLLRQARALLAWWPERRESQLVGR